MQHSASAAAPAAEAVYTLHIHENIILIFVPVVFIFCTFITSSITAKFSYSLFATRGRFPSLPAALFVFTIPYDAMCKYKTHVQKLLHKSMTRVFSTRVEFLAMWRHLGLSPCTVTLRFAVETNIFVVFVEFCSSSLCQYFDGLFNAHAQKRSFYFRYVTTIDPIETIFHFCPLRCQINVLRTQKELCCSKQHFETSCE